MKLLVTGGTGLLGNNILRQLTGDGHRSIALVRQQPSLSVIDGIDADIAIGDVLASDVIDQAVATSDGVIHSAGLIHLGWHRRDESMTVNQSGTKVLAEACRRHSKRLILVGTVNTLALGTKHDPADEQTALASRPQQVMCSYVSSKRAGVDVVRDMVTRGLSALVVHPGFMLGPWDWKPSSGRMITEVAKAYRPIAPSGGCSVCDVRDVARATINAVTADVPNGREFILAGENWSYKELWSKIALLVGRRPPLMAAGPLQRVIAGIAGDVQTKFMAGESDFNSAAVRMSSQFHYYNSSRARRELDYQCRSADDSLRDAVAWLRENELLPPRPDNQ
ncbi:MAG: NAD-dependent epimerase/dehydratase family protein [Planctomycetota bacterium]